MNTLNGIMLDGRPIDELGLRPPRVSVVVISWNYGHYIGAAIDSVRRQDYPNFDCIVIDNGSTDDSVAVINRHVGDDPRFKLITLQSNRGTMGAFQIALDHTDAEFVASLDADDQWFPNFLSCHVQVHLALSLGIGFTSSRVVEIDADNQIITGSNLGFKFNSIENALPGIGPNDKVPRLTTISLDDFNLLKAQTTRIDPESNGWFWSPGSGNVYRRRILNFARPEPSEYTNFIDVDIHFNRLCHILAGSAVIERTLSAYRMHNTNASNALPSMFHLRTAKRERAQAQERQRQEILRILLSRAESFSWLIKDRYWQAIDQQSGRTKDALIAYYADPEIQEIIADHLPQLIRAFGRPKVLQELRQRLPGLVVKRLTQSKELRSPHLSPRGEIDLIQLNSFYKRLAPPNRTALLHRIIFRLDQHFFGQSIDKKLHFVVHTVKFNFQRLHKILQARLFDDTQTDSSVLRVAVHGTGSLGDFLSHLMFVQEFSRRFGPMKIDFYAHPKKIEDAKFIFGPITFVRRVLDANFLPTARQRYDLVINLRYLIKYDVENSDRLMRYCPELLKVITEADSRLTPYRFVFDNHPVLDGMFARGISSETMNLADVVGYLGNINVDRNTFPAIKLYEDDCAILERHGLNGKAYVTVHDGFDTSYSPAEGTVTKCWLRSHWRSFVSSMKATFPDILIVQVGTLNAPLIDGVDVDLRNKTNLRQIAWVIKTSLIHIDGESGLVRLAHALHTKSVVIFGPTGMEFFKFDQNINLRAGACNDCWWSTTDWLSRCPRGLRTPQCMESVTAEMVLKEVKSYLQSRRPTRYEVIQFNLYEGQSVEEFSNLLALGRREGPPRFGAKRVVPTDPGLEASLHWQYLKCQDLVGRQARQLDRPLKIATLITGGEQSSAHLAAALAAKGHDVEVIDLDYLWDRHRDADLQHQYQKWALSKGLKVSYGSVMNIPAETGTYDMVLSMSSLDESACKHHALAEALRLVRFDGKCFLCFNFNSQATTEVASLTFETLKEIMHTLGIRGTDVMSNRPRLNQETAGPLSMRVASLVISPLGELIEKAAHTGSVLNAEA